MKKFGFSKKSSKAAGSASDNPYSQQSPTEDPYSNGPQSNGQGSMGPRPTPGGLPNGPRGGLPSAPRGGGAFGGPPAPRPAPPQQSNSYGGSGYGSQSGSNTYGSGGGYGGPPGPRPAAPQQSNSYGGSGYGSDRYGSGGGYGGSRYESGNGQTPSSTGSSFSSRPGGYGGMDRNDSGSYGGRNNYSQQDSQSSSALSGGPGSRYGNRDLARTNSSSTEVNRSDLFGGAQNRYAPDRGNAYASKSGGTQGDRYGDGNLARTDSSSTEANRGNLFGGAQSRYAPGQGRAYSGQPKPAQDDRFGDDRYGQSGRSAVSGVDSGTYGGYGEQRELTEQEQEDQKTREIEEETSRTRSEDVQSLGRTIQLAYQSIEVVQGTRALVASQGDRLRNAERNMDLADNYNAVGLDKAKELQTVNRSMFAVHVANPFTAKKRAAARDQEVMERHRMEKEQREETRRNHYQEAQAAKQPLRNLDFEEPEDSPPAKFTRENNPFITKYEPLEEEEKEKMIAQQTHEALGLVSILNKMARETGEIVDQQNRTIDRIAEKTDRVDYGVRRNRNELDKIR